MKVNERLSKILINAIGFNRSPIEFAKDCNINYQLIKDIILKKETRKLTPDECKRIAESSEIKLSELLEVCGYNSNENNLHGNSEQTIKRGDIFYADLGSGVGSEQGGVRPVIVISNNIGNQKSPCVQIAPITSKVNKFSLPTQVFLSSRDSGLKLDSMIMAEQTNTIDKTRLTTYIGSCPEYLIPKIDEALQISFGIIPVKRNIENVKEFKIQTENNFRVQYALA